MGFNGSSDYIKCALYSYIHGKSLSAVPFLLQKEAENVLSKRLAEVNEELHKSQARNTTLQKDLNSTAQVLRAEEAKTSELNKRLNDLTAADSNQADALNSLTSKLQEATARVSELQKMFTDVEDQLKKSQEIQMQKDKEIQVSCLSLGQDIRDFASQGKGNPNISSQVEGLDSHIEVMGMVIVPFRGSKMTSLRGNLLGVLFKMSKDCTPVTFISFLSLYSKFLEWEFLWPNGLKSDLRCLSHHSVVGGGGG